MLSTKQTSVALHFVCTLIQVSAMKTNSCIANIEKWASFQNVIVRKESIVRLGVHSEQGALLVKLVFNVTDTQKNRTVSKLVCMTKNGRELRNRIFNGERRRQCVWSVVQVIKDREVFCQLRSNRWRRYLCLRPNKQGEQDLFACSAKNRLNLMEKVLRD